MLRKRIVDTMLFSFQRLDFWMIGGMFFLIFIGLIMQYTIGMNQNHPSTQQFYHQCISVFFSIGLFFFFSSMDVRTFRIHPLLWVVASWVVLLAVLILGTEIKGTTGWFIIAGWSFQPVELVKVFLIIFFASYAERQRGRMYHLSHLLFTGVVVGSLIFLVLLQPDMGSSFIIFAIWLSYLFVLRAPWWFIFLVLGTVVLATIIGWEVMLEAYQRARLIAFWNPDIDPQGMGYNIRQSIVAVGSGALWGRGIGLGTQSQLHFLPEIATDFIFAVIAEELGFLGVIAVISAFGLIIFRLWFGMRCAKDRFGFFLLFGIAAYIVIQTLITTAMNVGLFPITGLPLPLVSAGGSSLLATMVLLGMAQNVIRRGR